MLIYILVIISVLTSFRAILQAKVNAKHIKALAVNQKDLTQAYNQLLKDLEEQ